MKELLLVRFLVFSVLACLSLLSLPPAYAGGGGDESPFNGNVSRLVECSGLEAGELSPRRSVESYKEFSILGFTYDHDTDWSEVMERPHIPKDWVFLGSKSIRRVEKIGNTLVFCTTDFEGSLAHWFIIDTDSQYRDSKGKTRFKGVRMDQEEEPMHGSGLERPLHYSSCKLLKDDPQAVFAETSRIIAQRNARWERERCDRKVHWWDRCDRDNSARDYGMCGAALPTLQ